MWHHPSIEEDDAESVASGHSFGTPQSLSPPGSPVSSPRGSPVPSLSPPSPISLPPPAAPASASAPAPASASAPAAPASASVPAPPASTVYTQWQLGHIANLLKVNSTEDIYNKDYREYNALQLDSTHTEGEKQVIYDLIEVLTFIYYSLYADKKDEKGPYLDSIIEEVINKKISFDADIKRTLNEKIETVKKQSIVDIPVSKKPSEIAVKEFKNIEVWVADYIKKHTITMDPKDNVKECTSKPCEFDVTGIKYKKMFSSGNNSDCMIHSILTASSPSFRKIKHQGDRDPIATEFRTNVFYKDSIKSVALVDPIGEIRRKQTNWKGKFLCYSPGLFLEAFQLGSFSDTYNFCVLMDELGQSYNIIADNAAKKTGIFLSNKGGGHFESVRRSIPIGTADPYLFTRHELLAIQLTKVNPKHANISSNKCNFLSYDIIEHTVTKVKYIVIELIFPEDLQARTVDCSSIRVITFLKDDKSKRTEQDILQIRSLDKFRTQEQYKNQSTEIPESEFKNYTIISRQIVDKDYNSRADKVLPVGAETGGKHKKNKNTRKHNAKKRPSKKSSRRR